MKHERWNKVNLEIVVANAYCVSDVCKQLGITSTASNYRAFARYCKEYELDCSHFNIKGRSTAGIRAYSKQRETPNELIFVEESSYHQICLKRRVIRDKLIEYLCSECGNDGEWNNKKLVLQLDHKNGKHKDNRIENLRFLCPNCHTQTETYTSKKPNQRKIY